MSRNLDQLHDARDALDADDARFLDNFLIGWLANATPAPMWDAALAAALESVEQGRITAV